jgi:Inner membrane component of T3SS, cytoplasmic domain/Domain of unknown function (DUF1707)
MRASRGRPNHPSPSVRACDADREQVIAELRDRFADGSLAQESFVFRVDAVLRARWASELAEVLTDLPPPRPPLVRAVIGHVTQAGHAAARRMTGFLQPPPPATLVLPSGTKESFTIGRDAASDLVLADMTVSRSHAGLRRLAGGWLLCDAGSTNGTRLNGWRVTEPVPVRAGDEVTFGSITLVVTDHAQRPGVAITP